MNAKTVDLSSIIRFVCFVEKNHYQELIINERKD